MGSFEHDRKDECRCYALHVSKGSIKENMSERCSLETTISWSEIIYQKFIYNLFALLHLGLVLDCEGTGAFGEISAGLATRSCNKSLFRLWYEDFQSL